MPQTGICLCSKVGQRRLIIIPTVQAKCYTPRPKFIDLFIPDNILKGFYIVWVWRPKDVSCGELKIQNTNISFQCLFQMNHEFTMPINNCRDLLFLNSACWVIVYAFVDVCCQNCLLKKTLSRTLTECQTFLCFRRLSADNKNRR